MRKIVLRIFTPKVRIIIMVNYDNRQYEEFLTIVGDLINTPEFERLRHCRHHYGVSRYQHCINVAYYSYILCKKFGLNYTAAARAGLLHDLFYYEWDNSGISMSEHALKHSAIALENAEKLTNLSELEADIIKNHMWLCSIKIRPRHKEAYIVSIADKICAVWEASYGVKSKVMLAFTG